MITYRVDFADQRRSSRYVEAQDRQEAIDVVFALFGAGFNLFRVARSSII